MGATSESAQGQKSDRVMAKPGEILWQRITTHGRAGNSLERGIPSRFMAYQQWILTKVKVLRTRIHTATLVILEERYRNEASGIRRIISQISVPFVLSQKNTIY